MTVASFTRRLTRRRPATLGFGGGFSKVKGHASPAQKDEVPLERERLLKRYDKAFSEMLARNKPSTLEMLMPILDELSPEIKAWTGKARLRVYLLMRELAGELDHPTSAGASLDVLFLLLSRGGKAALELARPIFLEKIVKMYGNARFQTEPVLPRLLLMLEDYSPSRVESLTKEAIHVWRDEEFRAAIGLLGFDELRSRGLRPAIKDLLGEEIARAGNKLDRTALNRAVELYHQVT